MTENYIHKIKSRPVHWDEVLERRVLRRITADLEMESAIPPLRRRPLFRVACAAGIVMLAGAAVYFFGFEHSTSDRTAENTAEAAETTSELRLADAGRALLSPGAEVEVVKTASLLVDVEQRSGTVQYHVDPKRKKTVIVRARDARILVVGTVFQVKMDSTHIRVEVERGTVQVDHRTGRTMLHAGNILVLDGTISKSSSEREPTETESLPPDSVTAPEKDAPAEAPMDDAGIERMKTKNGRRMKTERSNGAADLDATDATVDLRNDLPESNVPLELEQANRFEVAADSTGENEHVQAPVSLQQALAEVDDDRRRGDLSSAVRRLKEIVSDYPDDPSLPTVLFTLGKIARADGRYVTAANAFARCRKQNGKGLLAEDALAEESISWQKAGRQEQSLQAAERYLQLYPNGAYAVEMKQIIQ